ncbi:hypothetical protein [Vibrio phage vB_pir03]|nr:hypothetical protein [Vibrio phage vB_pir03]
MTFVAPNAQQNKPAETQVEVAQPQVQPQAAAQTAQPQQPAQQTGGFKSMLAAFGHTQVSSLGEGTFAKFVEATEEIQKGDGSADAVKFFHAKPADLALPIMVYAKKVQARVYFYALLPEALLYAPMRQHEELVNKNFAGGGKKITIDFPVSKCWNERYIGKVRAFLAEKFQVAGEAVVPVHFYAVGKNQPILEEGNVERIYNLAANAIKSKANPANLVDVSLFKSQEVQVDVDTEILPGQNVVMSNGRATACDAVITVRASERKNNSFDPHDDGMSALLSRTAVKFDTIRTPGIMPQMQPGMMHNGARPENHALLVLTGVDASESCARVTIENPLTPVIGLMSTTLLASGRNWESIFANPAKRGPISRDLGVLGYQYEPYAGAGVQFTPKPKMIEYTQAASSTDSVTFRAFCDAYFVHNSMTLAMDIGIGTAESWTQQLFLAAAKRVSGANDALINLFDAMTGGEFSKQWAQAKDKEVVQANTVIVHGGEYNLPDGSPSDIRHIDTLFAVAAAKEQAASIDSPVNAFSESFIPGATDGAQGLERLDGRRKDIVALEPSAEGNFDTLYIRVFFNPELGPRMAAAMSVAGINMNPRGLVDTQIISQLASGFVYGQAIDGNVVNNVFRANVGAAGSQFGNHIPGHIYI